jgi:serine/threonine-protein kinase
MTRIAGRYEVKAKLGEGGMGVVFRAYDPPPMDREVAVKTLHEFEDPLALELFYKECTALKSISHPNIVEIFDMGESEVGASGRPFFVMPLLPGQTLDELIRKASHRLTVERVVEIFMQTCRGLQAAHERGLIHRDLKPSNIFVMADDSVKLIDFGVAHAVHARSRTSGSDKGTLLYMAPEQIQRQPVSIQSDVYALGVTLYEALTRRQPFRNATEESVIQAILKHIPPPASDLNPAVSHVISRVVHKAMAKQPWNRFDSAREFGETLQKAYRNEPIAIFDPARTQPRIQTATKALEKGDFQFAGEIVSELEAEGNIDPQIALLRAQIDQIARQKTVAQLLESARARYEEQEDPLALQKLQEILQIDPTNVGALGLKSKIEDRRSERQIEQWVQLAQQHVSNKSYGHAREALQNALMLRPKDARAARMLKEVETEEQDYMRLRREKTELYQAAVNAWQNGEVSQALSQMKLVLDLDRRAPDASSPDAASTYQSFYNKIRSEYDTMNNGYAEARRLLADKQFGKALEICRAFLEKYPGQALFQALKFDVEEQQRQRLSAFIADVDRRLEAEPDLDAKVHLVREAVAEFPDEDHFRQRAKTLEDKRDLVNSIVERARLHESRNQFTEALNDLETLRTIYSGYAGLNFEKERLQKRLEQQTRDASRAKWVREIDAQLQTGDYARANELLDKAEVEFPADAELGELRKLAGQGVERAQRADLLVAEGQQLCDEGQFEQGVDLLKIALQLEDRTNVRMTLRDLLVGRAQQIFDTDWEAAEDLVEQALDLDPNHALGKSLRAQAADKRREQEVGRFASQARRLQADGQVEAAMAEVEKGLKAYPADTRLGVIAEALRKELSRQQASAAETTRVPVPPTRGTSPTRSASDVATRSASEAAEAIERTRIVPDRRAEPAAAPPGVPVVAPPAEPPADAPKGEWEKTQIVPRKRPATQPSPTTVAKAKPAITSDKLWIGIAAGVLVLLGAYFFWPDPTPPVPPESKIIVRGQPGTNVFNGSNHLGEIKPDGTFEFTLAAGTHELRFDLTGFLPETLSIRTVDGNPVDVTVPTLRPVPPPSTEGTIQMRGFKPGTRVTIDGGVLLGPIQSDGTLTAHAGTGAHTLDFEVDGNRASLPINLFADKPLEVTEKDVKWAPVPAPKPAPGPTGPAPGPAKPTTATLRLEQFTPGTRVELDGAPIGTVGADGTYTNDIIPPRAAGRLVFHRPGYQPTAPLTRPFPAGEKVVIRESDVTMTRLPATINFVTVPGTTVTIQQGGKAVDKFTNTATRPVPEGQYELVSRGPAGVEMTDPLVVVSGETRTVQVRVVSGMEKFDSGWGNVAGWYYRKATAEGPVPYDAPSDGRFTFTVRRDGGRGNQFTSADRLRWAIGYVDAQNHIVCEIDRDNFYRYERRNGATVKGSEIRVPHRIPSGSTPVHFTVQAQGGILRVSYSAETNVTTWQPIDSWNVSTPDMKSTADLLARGRFAFLLKAGEELRILYFRYFPPARAASAPAPSSPASSRRPDALPAVSAPAAGRTTAGRSW